MADPTTTTILMLKTDGALIQVKDPQQGLRHGFRTAQRVLDLCGLKLSGGWS